MTEDDKALHEQWDRTYDQLQFWVSVHGEALRRAAGDQNDAVVQFARTKLEEAEANHDVVVRRLTPSAGL
jgi:hypothetical protein